MEEINRRLITELEGLKNDWQLEVEELRRKLDMEVKTRMGLEVIRRELYEQVEEQKKLLRAESNALSEQVSCN